MEEIVKALESFVTIEHAAVGATLTVVGAIFQLCVVRTYRWLTKKEPEEVFSTRANQLIELLTRYRSSWQLRGTASLSLGDVTIYLRDSDKRKVDVFVGERDMTGDLTAKEIRVIREWADAVLEMLEAHQEETALDAADSRLAKTVMQFSYWEHNQPHKQMPPPKQMKDDSEECKGCDKKSCKELMGMDPCTGEGLPWATDEDVDLQPIGSQVTWDARQKRWKNSDGSPVY